MNNLTKMTKDNSLLPFLQTGKAGHGLLLSLLPPGVADLEKEYPFMVMDDSCQFSRLFEGRFTTASGTEISRLILLVQKDNYAVNDDALVKIMNRDVDDSWIEVLKSTGNSGGNSRFSLMEQFDQSSELIRNSSLFFCRYTKRFFYPLCPSCGAALQLCTDEPLLASCGLAPYNTSLTRYLYCSLCTSTEQQFYIFERDRHTPQTVHDRWSLIDRFSRIDSSKDPEGTFPCLDCSERQICYGIERAVRNRIIPFSFYPFQLMLFPAPDLSAVDYFKLLSGATVAEIISTLDAQRESHRIKALSRYRHADANNITLLDRHDPRFFLELLYLKIVFLNNVLEASLCNDSGKGSPLKTDRVWLHLATVSSPLPESWGFTVEIMPDVAPPRLTLLGRLSSEQTVAPLGLLWFQTLLQNKKVSSKELLQGVMEYLSATNLSVKEQKSQIMDSLTVPENIFWEWFGSPVANEWFYLWEEACECGFRLLDAACQSDCFAAIKVLKEEVSELSRKTLDALLKAQGSFSTTMQKSDRANLTAPIDKQFINVSVQHEPHKMVNDTGLRQILLRITDKYRQELNIAADKEQNKEADLLPISIPTMDYDPDEADTIIMGGSDTVAAPTEKPESVLQETVILSGASTRPVKMTETNSDDEIITETVMLSSAPSSRRGVPLSDESTQKSLPTEEELSETVILPQGMQRPRPGSFRK